MSRIESYLQSCLKKRMKNILLTVIIGLQMMYFRKPVGCFHIIWHTNAAKLPEYTLKPENTDISRPEKKAFSFQMKSEDTGTQLHHCRLLCRT